MLTILLLATIIRILHKRRAHPFILKDPEKSIKHHIKDPIRRDAMLVILKSEMQKFRKYSKRMKGYANVLKILTEDFTTSRQELDAIFEAMLAGIYHDQESRIVGRIKAKDYVTEEEFYSMISESVARRKAERTKNEKKWIEFNDKFEKSLDKLNTIIHKVVEKENNRQLALASIEKYRKGMRIMMSQMASWNYRDNQILRNYHATEEELKQTTHEFNDNRRDIFQTFVELYVQLGESLSEKERVATMKAMRSLV